jgi:predicted transcriptional regulator
MADLTVTAGSVLFTSGTKVSSYNAGEAITAGMCVYLKSSDSELYKAQADGTSAEATAVGIALHAAGDGQPLSYAATGSTINIGATTAKVHYLVSATAGGVAPIADITTSGHYITRLGYATAADGTFVVDIKVTGVTVT